MYHRAHAQKPGKTNIAKDVKVGQPIRLNTHNPLSIPTDIYIVFKSVINVTCSTFG